MSLLLIFCLITYPDSARIIGRTRHSEGIGGACGNRVSVRDSRGRIHCVYSSGVGSPYASDVPSDIFYVYSTDNGITWSVPKNISNIDTCNSDEPNLVIDRRDVLHLVWRQFYETYNPLTRGHDLIYAYCNNGIWSEPITINGRSGKVSYYTSLVVDSINRPHVVWDRQTGSGNWDIFYSYLDGDTWTIPFNISQDPYDSAFPSLAIDSQDHLHLVYRTRITNRPIMYTKYNGVNWSQPEVISDTFYGGGATIVVDSQNNPHVLFWGLYYTSKINNQWSYPYRICNMGDTFYTGSFAIAIDSSNNLYAVWEAYRTNVIRREDIYYTTFNGISWSPALNITQDTSRSWTPKLGNPVHSSGVDLVWLDLDPTQQYPWTLDVVYMRLNPVCTGIEEITSPHSLAMTFGMKVYPNPTKSLATIRYTLPAEGKVSLQLYDISGRLVKTLINEYKKPGNYKLTLNTKSASDRLSAGVYFVILKAEGKRIVERMVVVK